MKNCPKCHSEYSDEMQFCSKCGTSLKDKRPVKPIIRRVLTWIIVLLALGAFGVYKYYNSTSYLILEPAEISFPLKGDKQIDIDVNYDGHSYTIQHVPSWIEVTRHENGTFGLKAEPNLTGDDRTAFIVVKSGRVIQPLPVSQKGKATYILVNPTSLTFDRNSASERISVDCDGADFKVDSHPSWIEVQKRDESILVSPEENTTSTNKEGYIVLSSGDIAVKIPVRQGGATTYIRLEPSSLKLPKGAGSSGSTWTAGVDYDRYDFDITYVSEWLHAYKIGNQIDVSAEDNTTGSNRAGSITIKSGDITKTLTVNQNGKTSKLEVDTRSIKDDRYGGRTYTIHVDSDGTEYNVRYPTDLQVQCMAEHFTVKFPSNTDGTYRTGTIYVKSDNMQKSITVAQGGKCDKCRGSGSNSCSQCNGQGGWNNPVTGWAQCYLCKGAGSFTCSTCHGDKYREP